MLVPLVRHFMLNSWCMLGMIVNVFCVIWHPCHYCIPAPFATALIEHEWRAVLTCRQGRKLQCIPV